MEANFEKLEKEIVSEDEVYLGFILVFIERNRIVFVVLAV